MKHQKLICKTMLLVSLPNFAAVDAAERLSQSIPYHPNWSEKLMYSAPGIILVILFCLIIMYSFYIRSQKRLNMIAFYDKLTGDFNLNKFKIEVEKTMARTTQPYAMMVIDIDKFKSINDMYGYAFGDKMLIFLAESLHEMITCNCLICRGNADRFYIFLKYVDRANIENLFYSLAKKVEIFHFNDTVACKIFLSGGVCIVKSSGTNIISFIDRANIAAKSVKKSHKSELAFYDQSMYDQINNEKSIENSMSTALAAGEFVIYLQPKVELATMKTVGAEALARWIDPEKGLVMPASFIPLFEKNGFIVEFDFYVFEQVCKLLEHWKLVHRPLFTISVNLSRRHIQNNNTVTILTGIISKYDVSAKYIEIELTESAFVDCDVQTITNFLDSLHSMGFTVSVDDFGSGYSSLSLLKEIPIDVLKIDKSFFTVGQTAKAEILLESVISLSRKMGIKTVSEGVETCDQVNLLVHLGCDLVQGYYFARPMSVAQLESTLDTHEDV